MPTNKNLIYEILTIVFIIMLCVGGCSLYHKGKTDATNEINNKNIDNKIVSDTNKINILERKLSVLSDSVSKSDAKYNKLLKVHLRYQNNATQQRNAYTLIIKNLSDSLKNFKIDSAQSGNDTETLNAITNYPIVLAQFDTCISTNTILTNELSGKTEQLKLSTEDNVLKDTLIADLNKKIKLIPKQHPVLKALGKIGIAIGTTYTAIVTGILYYTKPK